MKKIFIFLFILILCISISVRKSVKEDNPIVIRSAEFIMKSDFYNQRVRNDQTKDYLRWDGTREDSTIIRIFTKDSLLIIDNACNDQYKLNFLVNWREGVNEADDDKWTAVVWLATDNANLHAIISFQIFKSKTIMITIISDKIECKYQGRLFKKKYEQMV